MSHLKKNTLLITLTLLFGGLTIWLVHVASATAVAATTPSAPQTQLSNVTAADFAATPTTTGDPSSITKEDGYTIWTYDYPDPNGACIPFSRLRWPINLGAQDPSDLSDTTLIFTFAQMPTTLQEGGGYYYIDPTWGIALNGSPGPMVDGTFTGEWNLVGSIGTEPVWRSYDQERIFVTQEVPFDFTNLIDGENNIWLQQQDHCPSEALEDMACTCYDLRQIRLRARAELAVETVTPADQAVHVPTDSEIRVTFTSIFSPTTVNENTFQIFYTDVSNQPVYVTGSIRHLENTNYVSFIPDAPLRDGVLYEARVWGENDARAENHPHWVQDIGGGPLLDGAHWQFWTMPELSVRLEPVQVLEKESLIAYKPTVLRVFIESKNDHHKTVAPTSLWEYVVVDDVRVSWGTPSASGAASWRLDAANWHFPYDPETTKRYRLYDKAAMMNSEDSLNYYGFTPDEDGLYLLRATVTLLDNNGRPHQFRGQVNRYTITAPWLNVQLRAIAVGSDFGKTGVDDLSYTVPIQRSGLQALYPTPNVRISHSASAVPFFNHPLVTNDSVPGSSVMKAIMLVDLTGLCWLSSDCDFLIGFTPSSWLVDLGLTWPWAPANASALVTHQPAHIYRFLAAHEGGHLYGFEHVPWHAGEGYDVRRRIDRRFSVAQLPPARQFLSFMNVDPILEGAQKGLWIERKHYRSLMSQLTDQTAQVSHLNSANDPLLLASGLITPTSGAVMLNPWYQLEPGSWVEPIPGPYRLLFLNSAGQEISGYTRSFAVSAELQPAVGPTRSASDDQSAPFLLKVPFPPTAVRLQIRRAADNALLAERVLAANPPDVNILPPSSNTWTGAQTINWQTAADDGRSVVQLSLDNGATWQAETIHLPGNSFTLETAGLPNSEQVLVRVLTSDGVTTGSDTAGPFTITNPLAVSYLIPIPDEENVSTSQPIYAAFRQPMNPATLTSTTFTVSGGPYGVVPGVVRYDAATYEATFTPHLPLAANTTYTAHLSTAVRATDGTSLAAPVSWQFTTAPDSSPPRPTLLSPPNGALAAPLNGTILAQWDRPLDEASLTPARFHVTTADGTPAAGTISYEGATQTAVFTPHAPLASHTSYLITLAPGIADLAGNQTTSATTWRFTTGAAAPAVAFSDSFADWGQDDDGDARYEQLIIRVGVVVTATADYRLRGALTDSAGAPIATAEVTAALTPGSHFLDLAFAGTAVGGHGVDGSYTLTELTLTQIGSSPLITIARQEAYQTFAYPAGHFPTPPTCNGLPDLVILPDNDFLDAFNVHDYAQHTILAAAELDYTIMFNSETAVGVAIQPSGALHITPEPYWQGETNVTIRASDGLHSVQDSFTVLVGWLHTSYLPVIQRNGNSQTPANTRNAWINPFFDDFEGDVFRWSRYASIMDPPHGPGGWYQWATHTCRAYSGAQSAWAYGGGDDGSNLTCGAPYPHTLYAYMYQALPVNLQYVGQGRYSAKVWSNLAPGAEVCLKVAVIEGDSCSGSWGRVGDYYGVCRQGKSNGWTDLRLDLGNVPGLGSALDEPHVCLSVDFYGGDSASTLPEGAYVDDVRLDICPAGLEEYCSPAQLTTAVPASPNLATNNLGGYTEEITDAALAVDDNGRVHALWTGKLNPLFDDFVFYSSSSDGVNWTPYQILGYWSARDPQIAVDDVHGVVHLAYANQDGIIHHTVRNGIVSPPEVVAPYQQYYLPGHRFSSGAVLEPSLTVAAETGTAYLLWQELYYVKIGASYFLRANTWHSYWAGDGWHTPLRKINDNDTGYSRIVASPDGQTMMAWFQKWQQSDGGGVGPGDPIVARTAYGTEPGLFPLRQATHELYLEPERDESILLAFAGGHNGFVLASNHFMWPGHSQPYRYLWQDGEWSPPLNVAENSSGWSSPVHVGAASSTPLIRCVYRENGILKTRTESGGQLQTAQTIANYLAARGYTAVESPVAYFTGANGGLHLLVRAQWNGVTDVYYVRP